MDGEQVLVVKRSLFEELGEFQGFCPEPGRYLERFWEPGQAFFMDRAAAEEDPAFKQLIPYCLLRHGARFLHYRRGVSGGERRLHALGSVGVGGHINPVDAGVSGAGRDFYEAGVRRELDEELHFPEPLEVGRVLGLINDDATPGGRVHLGVVHLIEVEDGNIRAAEEALAEMAWYGLEELRGSLFESLESWSQICVRQLGEGL